MSNTKGPECFVAWLDSLDRESLLLVRREASKRLDALPPGPAPVVVGPDVPAPPGSAAFLADAKNPPRGVCPDCGQPVRRRYPGGDPENGPAMFDCPSDHAFNARALHDAQGPDEYEQWEAEADAAEAARERWEPEDF